MKPLFIVIEGGEGAGKSTGLAALKEQFGETAIFTREPGGSPYAEKIRELALKDPAAASAPGETTLCLMFAARFDHIQNTVKPALEAGKIVVSDRFDGSSYAYNNWAQSDGRLEKLFWNLRGMLPVIPDLYVFFDVDPETGMRRAQSRNNASGAQGAYDHFDDRKVGFHAKIREGYLKFFAGGIDGGMRIPFVRIDANRTLAEVKDAFIAEIKKLY